MTSEERARKYLLDMSKLPPSHEGAVRALAEAFDDERRRALEDAAQLVATTNYYEPNETIARRIRNYDGDQTKP